MMPLNSLKPILSVIVVAYNNEAEIVSCLASIHQACLGLHYEVIVVDNASRDASVAQIRAFDSEICVLQSKVNLGFAAGNNLAFKAAQGQFLALVNPDARPEAHALTCAVSWLQERPHIGMAGGRLLAENGQDQPSARCFPSVLNDFLVISGLSNRFAKSRFFGRVDRTWADPNLASPVDWVPGAFVVLNAAILAQVGVFDERFFLYFEEVDLCRRIKTAGFEVWYQPDWRAVHIGGVSSAKVEGQHFNAHGSQLSLWRMRSAMLYYRKHHGWLGAWGACQLERVWHGLRLWRNQIRALPSARYKCIESRALRNLLAQAWRDTAGGRVSPPSPWL
ncbi:glycosyltransferase family 2 protein [uncultured Deefgea sp.]|uniref:glycosyltransferase family 2 protein n=1 Tax=uncultured Deefgea sp. TaxID=1304914 RepID=UPI002618F700|nr:glycosyltransferase family 2 protein [uncultured Deefgea sp.]